MPTRGDPAQTFQRLYTQQPAIDFVLQDIYDKLATLSSPSGVSAGTFVLAKLTPSGTNGSITINTLGVVTAFTPAT